VNGDLVEITKTAFNAEKELDKFHNISVKLNTLKGNIKDPKIKKGKISEATLDSIRNELSVRFKQSIADSNILIINDHHGLDRCNDSGNKAHSREDYRYCLSTRRNPVNVSPCFRYKSPEGTVANEVQLN